MDPSADQVPSDDASADDFPATELLSRRAEAGDEEAYAELYRRHYARVRSSAALRMGRRVKQCEQDIEDVVQEAFADVFLRLRDGRLAHIHTTGAFRNYLARVVVNLIRARGRSARRQRRDRDRELPRTALDSMFWRAFADSLTPSAHARALELEERFEEALLQLNERYRTAIDLVYNCGMTPAEVAEQGLLADPVDGGGLRRAAAVRLVVHRARAKLAALLQIDVPKNPAAD